MVTAGIFITTKGNPEDIWQRFALSRPAFVSL
jgi:hypothetical protein